MKSFLEKTISGILTISSNVGRTCAFPPRFVHPPRFLVHPIGSTRSALGPSAWISTDTCLSACSWKPSSEIEIPRTVVVRSCKYSWACDAHFVFSKSKRHSSRSSLTCILNRLDRCRSMVDAWSTASTRRSSSVLMLSVYFSDNSKRVQLPEKSIFVL